MSPTTLDAPDINIEEQQRFQSRVHLELNQVPPQHPLPPPENKPNFQRPFSDGDFEFVSNMAVSCVNDGKFELQLKFLSYEELQQRMATLDAEMEREIDELRRRYQTKRQPILDAMDTKRKRQQNF